MADQLPINFTAPTQTVLASYDANDLLSGTGYQEFWLMASSDDSGDNYTLMDNTGMFSNNELRETGGTGARVTDRDFDSLVLNAPRTIRGIAFLTLGIRHIVLNNNDSLAVTIYKWDGASEVVIAPTVTFSPTGGSGDTNKVQVFEMPCNETLLQVGDQIRLNIILTIVDADTLAYGHSPQNKDATVVIPSGNDTITSSRILIPFKIQ